MTLFDKITFVVGCLFFGGWALLGTFFYCKAGYDFIVSTILK